MQQSTPIESGSKLQLKIQPRTTMPRSSRSWARGLLRLWPIIFIIGVWFVFASPYFLKGLVPYASTYQVNFFPPWSSYEKFWGPVKNNAMPDVHGQIYPWKKFTIDTYKKGEIPLWNPYSFAGNPHLANVQSAVLSPFNLLFFLFPFIDAWSILVLLQPLLAGLFMYVFVREIGVGKAGSLISSVAFMFCGFIVVWMAYGTLAMAIAFLPLAFFALEKNFKTSSVLWLILLSMPFPLSFFSGHFQTSLYLTMFVFAFFIFKVITTKLYKKAVIIGIFLILGIVLSLPQLLPSIELYNHSVRSEIFIKGEGEGIPFYYLVNIFSPDFFGNPVTRNDWFGFYAEWASFIGITPLILAFFSLFSQNRPLSRFFFVAGIIALVFAIDSPLQTIVGSLKIPVLSTSTPSRIIVLFSFAFAVSCGLGLDAVRKLITAKKIKQILPIFIAMSVLLMTIWIILLVGNALPVDKGTIAKRNLVLPTLLFAGSSLAVMTSLFRKKFLLVVGCWLLVAVSLDSVRFAQKWMPFDPKRLVYPDTAIIDAIKTHINGGRVFGNLGGEATTYYGIPSIEGYDPLYIDRYGTFIRGSGAGEFLQGERSVVKLDRRGKYTDRVLDLLGVTIIFHPIPDTNQGWAYPVWDKKEKYEMVYSDDKFELFRNKQALPRAVLYYNYEVVSDQQDIIHRFYSDEFNLRDTLLLEEDPRVTIDPFKKAGKQEKVNIRSYTPNKVVVNVHTDSPALLFLSDNFYPGWKAWIDGEETKIYRADYTFRAVAVPEGESTITFEYRLLF